MPRTRMPLTRKERSLLAALMGSPGRCISRESLLVTVWGGNSSGARTVDVHIQRLRRKLGPKEAASIKTIVRCGYCWLPDEPPLPSQPF